jgi:pimeloyl-ACP methyl ester carboxylesterase
MLSARINGIDLYYESHGEGPALVFAHGRGGNHLSWWQQVAEFSRRYRCITFDHRGFGNSLDVPNGPGQGSFVEDLKGLLDNLGIERAHLVAQSMGGRTCLGFALAHPKRVDKLVLADTTCGVSEPSLLKAIADSGAPPTDLIERVLGPTFRRTQPELSFLYRQMEGLNRIGNLAPNLVANGPKARELQPLVAPTLLIVGTEDTIAKPHVAERFASMLPNARVAIIEDCGHSAYFEKPLQFNRIARDFLAAF